MAKPPLTDKEKATIRSMWRAGVSAALIQERLGRSLGAIYKVLREQKDAREDFKIAE